MKLSRAIRSLICVVTTIFTILSAPGESQGQTPAMTLRDCLIYARTHSPANTINRIEEEKAGYDIRIAISGFMPEVYMSGNGNISFGRNIDPETNTYDNKKTLSMGLGLNGSLPLFDGLVSINNLKYYKISRLRSQKYTETVEDMVSLAVIKAFYNVSYCKALVRQLEEQLERDERTLAATERGEQTGTKSGGDVAEIRAMVAADQYQLTNQRNLLSKAYISLRSEMGMNPEPTELHLIETISLQEDSLTPRPVTLTVNPQIAEAELASKQSLYSLRMAKGAFSPRITLNGGISTSYYKMIGAGVSVATPGFSKQWHDNMGQYVGFSVSIPLFTGLANTNRLKKAKAEYKSQKARLEQTRMEVKRLEEEAALDYRSAVEELRSATKRVEAEETAFKAVQRRFELGGASAIDLSTASTRLITARADLEGKRIQAIINRITLEYYYGIPLIDPRDPDSH